MGEPQDPPRASTLRTMSRKVGFAAKRAAIVDRV